MLAVAHNLQKILAHLSPSNDFIFVFQDKKKMRVRGARFGAPNDAWVKLTETTATLPDDAEFRALEAFMQTETGSGLIRVPVYNTVMYAHYAHTDGGFVVDSIYVPRDLAVPQFVPNISGSFKSYIKAAKTTIEKTNSLMSDFIGALQKLECSEAE